MEGVSDVQSKRKVIFLIIFLKTKQNILEHLEQSFSKLSESVSRSQMHLASVPDSLPFLDALVHFLSCVGASSPGPQSLLTGSGVDGGGLRL